ncbi:MAG: hypothetical protein M0000_08880 [Actinomycetota bacterium]|nr:hypothetical protein [Actinomycetota bacterium]
MGLAELWKGVRAMWNGEYGSRYKAPDWQGQSWESRRADYSTAIRLYLGQQTDIMRRIISQEFHENTARLLLKQILPFNLTRRVIDKLAMVYIEPPAFECESNAGLLDYLTDDLGGWLKQADRISELCGLCWVGPEWDAKRQVLGLTVISPDQVEPEWEDSANGRLKALTIYSIVHDDDGRARTLATRWTPEARRIYDGGKDVTEQYGGEWADGVNPYGLIPYEAMRPRLPLLGDPAGSLREDLVRMQLTLNIKLIELMALLSLQAGGQPVFEGSTLPAGVALGLGQVVSIGESMSGSAGGRFYYATPSADIAGCWNSIREIITYAGFLHGLGSTWTQTGPVPSGEALKVVNADLEEYRRDKWEAHQAFWWEFAQIVSRVLAVNGAKGVKDGAPDFRVEFASPKVYDDPIQERELWERDILAGIRSRVEWALAEHPEFEGDEAKARAYIATTFADERAWRGAMRPAAPTAEDLLGGGGAKGGA